MDNKCPQLYTCKWHPFWVSCFTDSRLDGVLVCFLKNWKQPAEIASQNPRPDPDNTGVGI
ncbi:hypothetical protein MSSD14B_12800 [Marinobacter salsuginis]|uniref:Uncharacterized protein n=1 Tax=Marinobacter salsuginis TaxID=418719 RepID=A0A5M3PXF7_9GAMM|nr:hypothetical protein MSSD14B_12800 [Marinobacter salsuginis]